MLITAKPKQQSHKKTRKSNRYSKYRGVSLNGKKWQVMVMGPTKKNYFGGVTCEEEAARLYDKFSIIQHGISAKTNFNYTKHELRGVLEEADYLSSLIF